MKNRLLAAALALTLCLPASAAAPRARLPVTNALNASAPMKAQVLAQIRLIAPLTTVPSLAPAAISPEAAAVVRGLLAQPELLKAHRAELAKALGPEAVAALAAVSAKKDAPAVQALLAAGPAVDPSDPAAVSRVAQIFDGVSVPSVQTAVEASLAAAYKLSLPDSWKLSKRQRVHFSESGLEAESLAMLKKGLGEMELPPYVERYEERELTEPAVAWAGLPSIWKLAVFREGGRISPGNVLYVLDSSWYIQVPRKNGKNHLYATKGLYFEKDGKQAVLVTYKHPRRVRYFGNLLTMGAFDTPSGVPLEKNLDTPMSSSSELERVTNDKLWTRILMAANGTRVPATRSFLLPEHPFLKRKAIPQSERVKTARMPASRVEVREMVLEFLRRYDGAEVVVKPSGPRFHSGEGVDFFPRTEVDKITDYAISLSRHPKMETTGVVLVEQRLAPPPLYIRLGDSYSGTGPFAYRNRMKLDTRALKPEEIPSAARHEKKDFNERVYVVRGENDQPITIPMTFFRAGTWGLPTSGQPKNPADAAAVFPFEAVREALVRQYGVLLTDEEIAAFMRERDDIGRRALAGIIANERTLPRKPGEPYQAQTDMVGLDIMYQLENGRMIPYVIEVNDHDAAGQHALDLFHPGQVGRHSTEWIRTWLRRAAQDAARNP